MGRAQKRKQQRQLERQQSSATATTTTLPRQTSGLPPLSQATPPRSWPVLECLVSEGWQTPGEIVQAVVARQSPEGAVAVSVFLIDLGCLGIKDAFMRRFATLEQYDRELREQLVDVRPMLRVDLNFVAKLVREAVAYARSLGFRPHKDYQEASPLLDGADPDAALADIPLGQDGQPLFVNGPYDNVPKILETLNRSVGEGNYHYLLGGPAGPLVGDIGDHGDPIPPDDEPDGTGHKPSLLGRLTHRDEP
jgi:hypothetical protein